MTLMNNWEIVTPELTVVFVNTDLEPEHRREVCRYVTRKLHPQGIHQYTLHLVEELIYTHSQASEEARLVVMQDRPLKTLLETDPECQPYVLLYYAHNEVQTF